MSGGDTGFGRAPGADYIEALQKEITRLKAELSVRQLLEVLRDTEMVKVHDEDGLVAIVIPAGGWWDQQLPEAPEEHFGHEHVEIPIDSTTGARPKSSPPGKGKPGRASTPELSPDELRWADEVKERIERYQRYRRGEEGDPDPIEHEKVVAYLRRLGFLE